MKISICIPYHNMPDTAKYLSRLLKSVHEQTYKDYEIILTNEGPFARNHNAAIMKAKGEFVQMLQMDDYFAHKNALKEIVHGLELYKRHWQMSACMHDYDGVIGNLHVPKWTSDIYKGNNRLGSVSCLSFRRDSGLLFEEPLTWVVDCDLYYRLYQLYGTPSILESPHIIVTERPDRLSNTLGDQLKAGEINYLIKKYGR